MAPRDTYFLVLRRTGPRWDPSRPLEEQSEEAVRATLARDPWSDTHLRVDTIDRWTIRLDGRRAKEAQQ